MVHYTNLLVASAVAAAVPALAAPFGYVESREIENVDAREPVFKAIHDIAMHGGARRVVTAPLKKAAGDALDQHQHPTHSGPGPVHQAMNKIKQEQSAKAHANSFDAKRAAAHASSKKKRDLEDFENVDAREPVFKAIHDIAMHGGARRVVTAPLRKAAGDALDQHQHPTHSGPGPVHHAMNKIKQEQSAKAHANSFDAKRAAAHAASKKKRDLEDFENFDAREPVFKAIHDIAMHGGARRVVTAPLRKAAGDALDQHQHPIHAGPGPVHQAMNKIKQEQSAKAHANSFDAKRAAAHAASKKKRDLEDFENFDAREPVFKAIHDIAMHGGARRVVTAPLRKTAGDALDQHQHPIHAGPGPVHHAMNKIKQEQQAKAHANSFDAKRAAAHAAHLASQKKRDLEDLLERDLFDLD